MSVWPGRILLAAAGALVGYVSSTAFNLDAGWLTGDGEENYFITTGGVFLFALATMALAGANFWPGPYAAFGATATMLLTFGGDRGEWVVAVAALTLVGGLLFFFRRAAPVGSVIWILVLGVCGWFATQFAFQDPMGYVRGAAAMMPPFLLAGEALRHLPITKVRSWRR